MAINLTKHREALLAAWKDVLDDDSATDWALFGYEGQTNDLKVVGKGDGGIAELTEELSASKIMYAFFKVNDPMTSLPKYVLLNWQGEGAPTVRKGTCANHLRPVSELLHGHQLTYNARTEEEMEEQSIVEKVGRAGSAYSFKQPRSEVPDQRQPVGTVYNKVIPGNEINAKERDQFWIKEEEEEKRRVAEEKIRREKERLKAEEELRLRDAREAVERESLADKRNEAISRRKAAEHSQELARRQEMDYNETQRLLKEQEESAKGSGMSNSEALRRQRSREAKDLIGHSTSQARAIFQQNSVEGQMNNKAYIPQKPVRNSVVAQRISSLSQQSPAGGEAKSPPCLSPPSEPPKTSPIKNIDKIKLSLESPSQIQQSIDPAISDLSPSEVNPIQFTSISTCNKAEDSNSNRSPSDSVPQNPEIKSNVVENDMYDSSGGNDVEDEDSDNKFSTIKRSPHSRTNVREEEEGGEELSRQNTVVENVNYKEGGQPNGNSTPEDVSPETLEDDGVYQDLNDFGLTARALYDYQAADDSEITFDPGDIITHIDQIDEGWWQGLGPQGIYGLFPANYVELLPHKQ